MHMKIYAPRTVRILPPLCLLPVLAWGQSLESEDLFVAEVDWAGEAVKGGWTALALGALFALGLTLVVERIWTLRRKNFARENLTHSVLPLWKKEDWEGLLVYAETYPCTLGRMVEYLVHHRHADPSLLIPGAQDIAARELRTQSQRTFLLAAVAGLAPLLGLLGTMIGMIESFRLVELYGDDGGASMLAGSISKALITTALGLIIAIPTLGTYHFFKYRISVLAETVERELETLVNAWLLGGRAHEDA